MLKQEHIKENHGEHIESIQKNKTSRPTELVPISEFRKTASQWCAAGALYLLMFSYGTSLGFGPILIAELDRENPEIPTTLEDLTWISSINYFVVPVSGLFSGVLTMYLGSRFMMMAVTIPLIAAWLIYHYATSMSAIFIGLLLTGAMGGLLESPSIMYVGEISEPRLRGVLTAGASNSVMFGFFMQSLLGKFFYWRTVVLINISFLIACFVAMTLVPESPYWFANRGQFKQAKASLAWLRGWATPDHVDLEFQSISKAVQSEASSKSESHADHSNILKQKIRKFVELYSQPSTYRPFLLVAFTFFVSIFNGSNAIRVFAIMIFRQIHSPIEERTAFLVYGIILLLASTVLVIIIRFTGKRKLVIFSTITGGLTLLVVVIYLVLYDQEMIVDENLAWIPTIMILLNAFVNNMGINVIPWILASECFPVSVRSVTSGTLAAISYICMAVNSKVHLYMVEGMTLAGTLFFYATINYIGLVVLYYVLPETEGRSLKEIEDHFAGVRDLKSSKNDDIKEDKFTMKLDKC